MPATYPSVPLPRTHPHSLGGLALLHGLPAPARSRVLDIGCGAGRNLSWIAATAAPETALGVDIDADAISSARQFAELLEVPQVDFRLQDFRDGLPAGQSEFDCIIANGLYSWVPAPVRTQLLAFINRHLSADGLAFVSFHEYRDRPWRKALLAIADPDERLLAARLDWAEQFADIEDDGLLVQDALAEVSDAISEDEFRDALEGFHLEYLCDAKLDGASPDFHEAVLIRRGREAADLADRIWWVTEESFPATVQCASPPPEAVEILSNPRPLTTEAGPCPLAWRPAVLQASKFRGDYIFNYTGALVDLSDPADRELLLSLDGRTPAAGETIEFFARAGLLIST